MSIRVYEGSHDITRAQLGTYNLNRADLRRALSQWLTTMTPAPIIPLPSLQGMADKYGEQITLNAEGDLQQYITFMQGGGLSTPGGVPTTGFSPLAMNPRHVAPSNTAISVLGEGLAGWYLEHLNMTCLVRPIGRAPDLVFEDVGKTSYTLVEVKGSQQSYIHERMGEAIVSLFNIGSNLMHVDPYTSYDLRAIGVIIRTAVDYELYSLNISVR